MVRDKFKSIFAPIAAKAFKTCYPVAYKENTTEPLFDEQFIYESCERPKDTSMGRFAFPVFRFSRLLKEKPPVIAENIAKAINNALAESDYTGLLQASGASGFINVKVAFVAQAKELLQAVLKDDANFGASDVGNGQTALVEYSSANIAKPFGVGHLRSTIIGNSLRLIYKKLGYNVVGINFLGDWGTQFGKMIVAYRKWASETGTDISNVNDLVKLYVRFHTEAETNKSLEDEARETFRALENGDPETVALWRKFKDVSLDEFNRIYKILGVEFDVITSEADLNDRMEPAIKRLEKVELTSISDGALIVDLGDDRLPPVLLKKSDGATLYATRDIAGLLYRWEKYHFAKSLYIVGQSQADHFKQVFKVMAMMEEVENLPESDRMTGKCEHIGFGWVKFGDQKFSTRSGNVILLEDVLKEATALVAETMKEKNREMYDHAMENKSGLGDYPQLAESIGVGAVIFSQLSVKRQKDVNFIWEQVLNFEGETGPYLQYTHARLCSLIRNGAKEGFEPSSDIDYKLLEHDAEKRVIELLADYPMSISDAAREHEPYFICNHLFKLAAAFNTVYQRRDENGRSDKIISTENPQRSVARLSLVKAVQTTIKDGLNLLGLSAPEAM